VGGFCSVASNRTSREDRAPSDYDGEEPVSEMMTKLREQHDITVKLLNELAAIQDRPDCPTGDH
jgi:hypothetical protein